MSQIADFLLARIAEEEQSAQWSRATAEAPTGYRPARILAHCAARRQIIALHEMHVDAQDQSVILDGESGSCRAGHTERDYMCPTLRLLAMPYCDHIDFKPEWATTRELLRLASH